MTALFSEEWHPRARHWWPHRPESPGEARTVLAFYALVWMLPNEVIDSAELVLSELITNAILHAAPPPDTPRGKMPLIETVFVPFPGGVRIEVHDESETKPEIREASDERESGRGLALVDALTGGRWGVCTGPDTGKTVWAECRQAVS
ncbi:ATP-binding protein [Actinacidiphila acididurans]|uniref:ATP-binding protein n=1 Tax=Actinacidiphila acididurans TaxID=2784346 RepID=A0ABS2TME4_9ACTN|nr:ATP-binding protein [Actinacidiphila acididurans]MBM9504512.1 ATP-binding protein [Actinacidiphila acididurans]